MTAVVRDRVARLGWRVRTIGTLCEISLQCKPTRHTGRSAEPEVARTQAAAKDHAMKNTTLLELKNALNHSISSRLPQRLLAVAAALALAGPASALPAAKRGDRELDVMTLNLYVGGDIGRITGLDPTDPNYFSNLVATVTGVYLEIVASNPPARLETLAKKITTQLPDMVAVQEASLIRMQVPGDLVIGGTTPATTVVYDYLELLVDQLHALGADYRVVSTADQIDVEMPMLASLSPLVFADVRLSDRDAILVRGDLPPGHLRVSHPQSGNFTNVVEIPGTGLDIERGWCSVDVALRGRDFRFICTHLEIETIPEIQVLQVQELLAGPADTCLPVILVGDFNADSLGRDGSTAYPLLPAAGFVDAWAELHPSTLESGLTWGHDEFLSDPDLAFNRRIDFIFSHGKGLVPRAAAAIDLPTELGTSPLWASDHAAVTATFLIK